MATAVRAHIEKYTKLLLPAGGSETHPPAELNVMQQWQRSWISSTTRANAIHTVASIDHYFIRYETTLLSGWTRGPDHQPTPPEEVNYFQLYGDDNRLFAFLANAAPHCYRRPADMLADGTGSIQFIHEAQYRNELYRLQGTSSPSHGITRPLRLTFQQLRRPSTQCCSVCGEPDHTARSCPLHAAHSDAAANVEKMDADAVSLPTDSVVCRLCYSPGHREDCHTPPSLQHCKICNEDGHTSFRCRLYKSSGYLSPSLPRAARPTSVHWVSSSNSATSLLPGAQ